MTAMMNKKQKHDGQTRLVLLLLALLFCPKLWGQDSFSDGLQMLEIEGRMLGFYNQLSDISGRIPKATADELVEAGQQVTAIDTKWNAYYQLRQAEIAADDSLLQIVADYQLIRQSVLDSIAGRKHYYDSQKSFSDAEAFICSQDTAYERLYKTAFEYSLVKSLAPELDKVKGKEQLLFAEVQSRYENAKALQEEFGELKPRFLKMEELYIGLKNTSEKIQALEFKPWFDRIKDYLYSLAAVALILMFANMVQAKIKAFKQARENAKKFRQMMNQEEDDYPTI